MTSDEIEITSSDVEPEDVKFKVAPIFLVVGIAVSAVMPVFLTGALAVQIRRDLNLTPSLLGAAVATFFGFAALSSYLGGRISHKVDGARTMRICLIASSFSLFIIGAAARNYLVFILLLAVSGVINGTLQPPINVFISHVIPKRRQGFAYGVKQAAVPVSTLLAGLAVPFIALTVGWRYAYIGVVPLGLILYFFVPKSIAPTGPGRSIASGASRPSPAAIAMLALAMGLGTGAANSFGAFIVSSLVHSGWNPGVAGLLTVGGSLICAIARIGNGLLADRRSGRHFLFAAWSAAIGALGYFMLVFGFGWLIIPGIIVSYGAAWGWNGLFIFGVVRNFPRYAGYATGTVQSGAYVGSVLGPLSFGVVVEHAGYSAAWTMAGCLSLAAVGAILIGRRLTLSSEPGAVG